MSSTTTEIKSDYNLHTVSTNELQQHIHATIDYGGAMFVLGSRGIGKTWITQKAIKDAGYNCLNFALATYDKADFLGYPDLLVGKEKTKDNEQRYVEYILPKIFKSLFDAPKKSVVFFDEVDKASSELWAPLLEFVQFHKLNDNKLTNLQAIICSGNHLSEGGQKPISPLLDRMEKYVVEVNPAQWLDWAATKDSGMHPTVSSFIKDNTDCLQGETDMGDLYANESPRSWHNSSNLITFGEKKGWSKEMIMAKVSGCVGKRSGNKFSAYFNHYQVILPLVEKVLRGESIKKEFENLPMTKSFVLVMTVCSRIAITIDSLTKEEVAKKVVPEKAKILGKWLNTIDEELALLGIRGAIGIKRCTAIELEGEPSFDRLLRKLVQRTKE